jgi:hypothetical protein
MSTDRRTALCDVPGMAVWPQTCGSGRAPHCCRSPVGDDGGRRAQTGQEFWDLCHVGGLSGGEDHPHRQTVLIDHGVDLGDRSSTRTANRVIWAPFSPAACWWARMMELSIICIDCGIAPPGPRKSSAMPRPSPSDCSRCIPSYRGRSAQADRAGASRFAAHRRCHTDRRIASSSWRSIRRSAGCGKRRSSGRAERRFAAPVRCVGYPPNVLFQVDTN